MGDASEPVTEWGKYLRRGTKRPGWSVARLAREAEIARQTIFDWIRDGGESVTIGYVRRVADALGDDLQVALLAAANMPAHDEEIDRILRTDVSDDEKRRMVEYVENLREAQRAARRTEVDAMLNRPRPGQAA